MEAEEYYMGPLQDCSQARVNSVGNNVGFAFVMFKFFNPLSQYFSILKKSSKKLPNFSHTLSQNLKNFKHKPNFSLPEPQKSQPFVSLGHSGLLVSLSRWYSEEGVWWYTSPLASQLIRQQVGGFSFDVGLQRMRCTKTTRQSPSSEDPYIRGSYNKRAKFQWYTTPLASQLIRQQVLEVFFRCGTPKDAVQKDYKAKPLVRRSIHSRILQ